MVGVAGFEPATKRGLHYVCRVLRALYVPDNKKSTPGRSTLGVLYNYGGILFGSDYKLWQTHGKERPRRCYLVIPWLRSV